jgi:16S rRNA (uracil1498-N3)-methyltransferase
VRLTRVFVEQKLVSGKGVGLPEQAGLHLTRVLRLEPGTSITLFDGSGEGRRT